MRAIVIDQARLTAARNALLSSHSVLKVLVPAEYHNAEQYELARRGVDAARDILRELDQALWAGKVAVLSAAPDVPDEPLEVIPTTQTEGPF